MSISPLDPTNQTTTIPNSLLGYSSNGVSALEILPTSITIGGLLTTTPIYVGISATTGLTTTNPTGLNVNCDFNMNQNNITSVASIIQDGNDLNINNGATATDIIITAGSVLNLTGADSINMTAQNSSMSLTASTDITLQSASLGTINTNAPNSNSYGNALPICLNVFEQGTWSYTLGGQAFQNVFSTTIPLPTQFFAENTTYTSTRWQINFDMNCWNFANAGDKGFAIYLLFLDSGGNTYDTFLYNQQTPFCKWDNPPTFVGANSQFKSINWCDYVDFNGLIGSNDSNITLEMYIAGDNVFNNVDFKIKLGFTRIQRV